MEKYTSKYMIQRATALVMLPIILWFTCVITQLVSQGRKYWDDFITQPMNIIMAIMLVIILMLHADIGMRTVFDDYIQNKKVKIFLSSLLHVIKFFTLIAAIFSLIALHIIYKVA